MKTKKRIDKYKINRDITVELLKKQSHDTDLAKAANDRNIEAVNTFGPWISGNVLEVGCRHGLLLEYLRNEDEIPPVLKMYGIDISPEAVAMAKEKGLAVEVMAAEDMDWHNKFDTVFCFHTLEHCINVPKVIKGMYKCLKPGGFALIEIPIQPKEVVPTVWGHYHCFSWTGELIEMACPPFKHIHTFQDRRYVFEK